MDGAVDWVFEPVREVNGVMHASLCFMSLLVSGLTACAPAAPRLHQPDRIEVYCGDRATVATAIESIVASSGEVSERAAVPSDAQIRKMVESTGGIVAHWNDQLLYEPRLAKLVGEAGDYVTIGDAAISDAPRTDSRPIYLTVKTGGGRRTFALRAYDVQDVCNLGKRSS